MWLFESIMRWFGYPTLRKCHSCDREFYMHEIVCCCTGCCLNVMNKQSRNNNENVAKSI